MLLREAYEISYYIYNHDAEDTHPWALVLDQPQENFSEYGTLYRTVHSYRLRDVNKRFGLSLTEFLDLPREMVELIIKICDDEAVVDGKSFSKVKRELEEHFE